MIGCRMGNGKMKEMKDCWRCEGGRRGDSTDRRRKVGTTIDCEVRG